MIIQAMDAEVAVGRHRADRGNGDIPVLSFCVCLLASIVFVVASALIICTETLAGLLP